MAAWDSKLIGLCCGRLGRIGATPWLQRPGFL